MNKKQLARLKELLGIKKADRSEDEQKEFDELFALAEEKGVDITKLDEVTPAKDPEGEDGLSEEDVKKLVQDGVSEGLKALGIEPDSIKSIQDKLEGQKTISAEDIQAAVKAELGDGANVDVDALKKAVSEAAQSGEKGVTKEELEKVLGDFEEKITKSASKHKFPTGSESRYPVEHRSGNLSVGQKQLLNIMLGSVSDEALEKGNQGRGTERPKGMNDGIEKSLLDNAISRGRKFLDAVRNEIISGKALTSTGSGSGDELVPSDLSSELQFRLYLESAVAAEMIASEVTMPTNPFTFPLVTTRPTFKTGSENPGSDPTESSPGTGNLVFNAQKLIGMTRYSYEADEDSIISILPMVTEQLGVGAADALEGALINGDDDGTHQDSDIQAVSNHASKLFDGWRKLALAVGALSVDLSSGGISAANILAMKKAMGKYGVRPADLALIMGVSGYNDVLGLSETLTAEKVGSNVARILTGEAPTIYGIRIIVSSQIREDLNASGVYDGTTTSKGSFLLVHKPSWMLGVKRGFLVETEVDKRQQVNDIIASFRRDFQPKETPSATVTNVALGYNYDA